MLQYPGILWTEWNERKTLRQSAMNFYPEYTTFLLDFYFLMSLYYIAAGGGSQFVGTEAYLKELISKRNISAEDTDKVFLLFPELVCDAGGTILRAMQECSRNEVDAMPPNQLICAKSLRFGGLQEVMKRTHGYRTAGIFRGGWWNFEYEHTYQEYMSGCFELLMIAGKAISGYPHAELNPNVHPPTLDVIFDSMPDAASKMKLESFIKELYVSFTSTTPKHVHALTSLMFASLLRFFNDFITQCGVKHFGARIIIDKAKAYGYSVQTLLVWGQQIGTPFWHHNFR
jgi:hypothetical protein